MSSRTTRNLLIAAIIMSALVIGVWAFRSTWLGHAVWPPRPEPTMSDVPVFVTPVGRAASRGSIYLRVRKAVEDDSIFITRGKSWVDLPEEPDLWPVYRYNPRTRNLSRVESTNWKTAAHETAKAGRGNGARFLCKEIDGILKFLAQPGGELTDFDTVGEVALRPTFSPDSRLLCLLTADNPERPESPGPGMVFGTVGGGYYGQHYLEFYNIPEMTIVRNAIRIPFTTVDGIGRPCWSPDGRFLIYPNRDGTRMCIIHVQEEGQQP